MGTSSSRAGTLLTGAGRSAAGSSASSSSDSVLIAAQYLEDALQRARELRHPGVAGGLYGLEGLVDRSAAPAGEPLDELPTLRLTPEFPPVELAASDAEFRARLFAHLPALEGFDLKKHGLFLAGGCPAALLRRREAKPFFDDADFFLVGHPGDAERRAAIGALGAHLACAGRVDVLRTPTSLSFIQAGAKFQVVLRGYATPAEVLHGFDLGSCSVGFDGDRVWLSELGVIAAELGLNVVCLDGYRPSYDRRVVKYFHRGYALALPGFRRDQKLRRFGCVMANYSDWPTIRVFRLIGDTRIRGIGESYEASGGPLRVCGWARRNVALLLQAPPRLEALTAFHPFDGELSRPAEVAAGCDEFLAALQNARIRLSVQGGHGGLSWVANAVLGEACKAELAKRLRRLRTQYPAGYDFPLRFREVEAGTLLTAAAEQPSLDEWYCGRDAMLPPIPDFAITGAGAALAPAATAPPMDEMPSAV